MASLGIPAFGYGIRYRHGLFRQKIIDGVQIELPEDWLVHGNPWEFKRRERELKSAWRNGRSLSPAQWRSALQMEAIGKILAVAFDTPICGWKGKRVNTLRLWNARPVDPIKLDQFNQGDHIGAQVDTTQAESITRVALSI
jgi:starch phosphorylase